MGFELFFQSAIVNLSCCVLGSLPLGRQGLFPGRIQSQGSCPALMCEQAGSAAAGCCFPDDTHTPSSGALFICCTDPDPNFPHGTVISCTGMLVL